MQTITCPCCLTEYDDHDSPAEYARVNKQNTMNEAILVMNSHIKGGKTLYISRNDKGEQGIDFIADIPPFIGNEKWAILFSAAPELLEACKLAERYYLPTPVLIALRNAILKATT